MCQFGGQHCRLLLGFPSMTLGKPLHLPCKILQPAKWGQINLAPQKCMWGWSHAYVRLQNTSWGQKDSCKGAEPVVLFASEEVIMLCFSQPQPWNVTDIFGLLRKSMANCHYSHTHKVQSGSTTFNLFVAWCLNFTSPNFSIFFPMKRWNPTEFCFSGDK